MSEKQTTQNNKQLNLASVISYDTRPENMGLLYNATEPLWGLVF